MCSDEHIASETVTRPPVQLHRLQISDWVSARVKRPPDQLCDLSTSQKASGPVTRYSVHLQSPQFPNQLTVGPWTSYTVFFFTGNDASAQVTSLPEVTIQACEPITTP